MFALLGMALCIMMQMQMQMPCRAEQEQDPVMDQYYSAGGNMVGESIEIEDFDYTDAVDSITKGKSTFSGGDILSGAVSAFLREIKLACANSAKILIVAVALSVVAAFCENKQVFETGFYVCMAVVFIQAMSSFNAAMDITKNTMENMGIFMKTAIPMVASMLVASGKVVGGAAMTGSLFAIYGAAEAVQKIVYPLAVIAVSLGAVNNLSDAINLRSLFNMVKKAAVWILGIVSTLFSAMLFLQSVASSSASNAGAKVAKYAIGSFVPFVGGMLSDSLESVIASSGAIKSAAGIAGVFAIVFMCLTPIIQVLAIALSYKLLAVVLSPVADKRIVGAMEDFSSGVSILIAMLLSVSMMFIVAMGIVASI